MKIPYLPTNILITVVIYLSTILLAVYIADHMHGSHLGRNPSITITH